MTLEQSIERLSSDVTAMLAPAAIDLLDTIPGVNRRSAEVLLAEIGPDMSRFASSGHLASWAGMCPGNNESAGKRFSGKTRKGSKWLRTALVESAEAAARTKGTYLASQYARIKGRHGHSKAIAVAHSILVIAYHILQRREPYNELGGDYFIERQNKEAYQRRLVKQLERMGYDVTLENRPAACRDLFSLERYLLPVEPRRCTWTRLGVALPRPSTLRYLRLVLDEQRAKVGVRPWGMTPSRRPPGG